MVLPNFIGFAFVDSPQKNCVELNHYLLIERIPDFCSWELSKSGEKYQGSGRSIDFMLNQFCWLKEFKVIVGETV